MSTTSKQVQLELELLSKQGISIPTKARALAKRLHEGEYSHLSISDIAELVIQLGDTIRSTPRKVKEWKVLLDNQVIDNVFFDNTLDGKTVRKMLIRNDNYPSEIQVQEHI